MAVINGRGGGYRLGGYAERAVPAGLSRWAEVFWTYAPPSDDPRPTQGIRHRVIPETGMSVCAISWCDGHGRLRDAGLWVMGPLTRPRLFTPEPDVRMDGLRLKVEWCRDLLGLHPADLEDAFEALRPRCAPRLEPLERALQRVRTPAAVERVLERWAWELGQLYAPRRGQFAHALLERVRRLPHEPLELPERAKAMGVSERHLRRLVREATGHGPKHFQRVRRLQRAVSLGDGTAQPRWSAVAASSGYADQSHLIQEFRRLTGAAPRILHAERRHQRRIG